MGYIKKNTHRINTVTMLHSTNGELKIIIVISNLMNSYTVYKFR